MRDELTFNASDSDDAPDALIEFTNRIQSTKRKAYNNKLIPMINLVSDELTFNAFDSIYTPDELILLSKRIKCQRGKTRYIFWFKSNVTRVELTFSADDNEEILKKPISLSIT